MFRVNISAVARRLGLHWNRVAAAIDYGCPCSDVEIRQWCEVNSQYSGKPKVFSFAKQYRIKPVVMRQIRKSGIDITNKVSVDAWLDGRKARWKESLKKANRFRDRKDSAALVILDYHKRGLMLKSACESFGIPYQAGKNYARELGLKFKAAAIQSQIGKKREGRSWSDITFSNTLRSHTIQLLKRGGCKISPLCGISGDGLRQWVESKFRNGMTWKNHGKKWQLDHVFPLSKFDLSKPEQQRVACNWQNLHPLLRRANAKKGGKITKPQLPLALIMV